MRQLLLIAALLCAGCQTFNPLRGNWELVSSQITYRDGTIRTLAPPDVQSLKVLGATRFACVTVAANGRSGRSVAGRYRITWRGYSETIEISSDANEKGKTYKFTWRLEGDLWYHRGVVGDMRFEEVWRVAR